MNLQRQKTIARIVLVVLVVILIFQNTDDIQTRVFFWNLTMPTSLLLGATLVLGLGIGYLTSSLRHRRSQKGKG